MIQQVKKDDLGKYVCIISKPGNTIERNVWVREKGKVIRPLCIQKFLLDILRKINRIHKCQKLYHIIFFQFTN